MRRFVMPERRYLKLGGGLLRMQSPEWDRFMRGLREDAELAVGRRQETSTRSARMRCPGAVHALVNLVPAHGRPHQGRQDTG
ncbi:DUF6000 family protein [Streptomyces sp. NPDC002248]|nr:DUF6000 family protein [Streptomyces sp. GZWMJZ-114]